MIFKCCPHGWCFAIVKMYAVVTPLRKAASYEPRIAILGIWGDTWLTRGKYCIYVAVRSSYGALMGSTWRLLSRKISPIYCRVSYVAVTTCRIPSLVLRNTWHYVIIRYSYGELPKFVLRCSFEAGLRKGVTTALLSSLVCCLLFAVHQTQRSGPRSTCLKRFFLYFFIIHFWSNVSNINQKVRSYNN